MKRHFKGKGDYEENKDSSDSELESENENGKGSRMNNSLRTVNIKQIEKRQKISKPIETYNEKEVIETIVSESEDNLSEISSDDSSSSSSSSSSSDDSASSDGFNNKKIAFVSKTKRSNAEAIKDDIDDFKKKSINIVEKNLNKFEQNKLTDNLKNSWEYNENEIYLGLDDSDNVDPEKEYMAWKLRELKRLRRDRNYMIEREIRINEMELHKKR